jgi:pimeloyl-ACP methyl ester carboxylesterase
MMYNPASGSINEGRRRLLNGSALLSVSMMLNARASAANACVDTPEAQVGIEPVPIPAQAPTREGMAKLENTSLWYWDTGGDGVPIVLLHPFTGSGHVWPYQQPALSQAGYRVIGYSRRGFQGSEPGPGDNLGTGSGDLHDLLRFLRIERFHAVASAGGAFVAADYALLHPERLYSIVLACTILGIQDAAFASMTDGLRTPGFENLPAHFRELGPSYRAADPAGTELWKELERNSMPGQKIMQPYTNKITLDKLAQLKAPTLLIAGDSDLIAPPPVGRLLASHIPQSELRIFTECGHSAYWERPLLFNRAILDFIGKHGNRSA